MEKKRQIYRGITFGDGLQLLLIGLKFTGYIDWNWGKVLIPMWIYLGILTLIKTLENINKRQYK